MTRVQAAVWVLTVLMKYCNSPVVWLSDFVVGVVAVAVAMALQIV